MAIVTSDAPSRIVARTLVQLSPCFAHSVISLDNAGFVYGMYMYIQTLHANASQNFD